MGSLTQWLLTMHFPVRLIQLRKAADLTQQDLAETAALHVNQIRRYEAGTAQPTLEALIRLAKALRVSLDNLVFVEDERGPDDHVLEGQRKILTAAYPVGGQLKQDPCVNGHSASRWWPR
jgi:transcriptional regulator with XRE-family HTH domain